MTITDRIRVRLPRGAFSRGVLTVALGTGLSQVVVIAASPILTRLYEPSVYGAFAVALSVVAVLMTVTCLRYDFAIPLPSDERVAANLLALSVGLNIVMSVAAGCILWVAGAAVLSALGGSSLAPFVLLIPLGQFGGGLASALTNLAIREKAYPTIARARLTQSTVLVAIQIVLGGVSAGAAGLLVGDAAGRLVGASQLAAATLRRQALNLRSVSFAGVASAAHRYRRFPVYSSWSALIATLGLQAPLLFLVAFYGAEPGGIYALAARVCAVPVALVATAVGQVFTAESAQLARADPDAVKPLYWRVTKALAGMAIVPSLVVMAAAPILAGPIFGSYWAQVGVYIAILVPSYFAEFVAGATGDVLGVVERQDLHLVREVIRFALIGLAIPVAAWLGLPTTGAIIMLSAAGVLAYGCYGLIGWYAVHRPHARPADPSPSSDDPGVVPHGESDLPV